MQEDEQIKGMKSDVGLTKTQKRLDAKNNLKSFDFDATHLTSQVLKDCKKNYEYLRTEYELSYPKLHKLNSCPIAIPPAKDEQDTFFDNIQEKSLNLKAEILKHKDFRSIKKTNPSTMFDILKIIEDMGEDA